ncbi:MAG: FAD-dependent oxidoreductase [Saccharolobus sp.]
MTKLIIVGSGISGLLTALMYSGDSIILEKEKEVGKNSKASLWSILPPLCGAHKEECEQAIKLYEEICEKYGIYCKKTHILRVANNRLGGKIIDKKEIKSFELQLNLEEAELFDNGFFVEGEELINSISTDLNIETMSQVINIRVENNEVKYLETNRGIVKGDFYILATGYLTSNLLSKIGLNLTITPYKGHLIIMRKVGLNGILIVNDRIAVEGKNLYLNGDSSPTSSSEVEYNEISKTINEIGKVLKVDTTNFEVRVGFRSVSSDGEPIIRKIYSNMIVVTGYKFGFALAPIFAKRVIEMIKSEH